MADLLYKLLQRAMGAQDADPLPVMAPGELMKGRSNNSACGQQHEALAKEVRHQPFRIIVEEAEVVKEPFSAAYKLVFHSAKGEHRLNKNYSDIERLGKALAEELPTVMLPRLPRPRAHEKLVDRGFRTRLGVYFFCLACNQSAIETVAFNNFIQLADDAQRPLQQERKQADGQTPHIGDGRLRASPKRVRFATPLTEPSAPPAITQPHRRKTKGEVVHGALSVSRIRRR